jgi:hypothetical protein
MSIFRRRPLEADPLARLVREAFGRGDSRPVDVEAVLADIRSRAARRRPPVGLEPLAAGGRRYRDGTSQVYAEVAESARQRTDEWRKAGCLTWAELLRTELYTVLSQTDPGELAAALSGLRDLCGQWLVDLQPHRTGGG